MRRLFFGIIGLLLSSSLLADDNKEKCYTIDTSTDPITIWVKEGCTDTLYLQEIVDSLYHDSNKTVYGDNYNDDVINEAGKVIRSDSTILKKRYIEGFTTQSPKCPIAKWDSNRKMYVKVNSADSKTYNFYHTDFKKEYRIFFLFKQQQTEHAHVKKDPAQEEMNDAGAETEHINKDQEEITPGSPIGPIEPAPSPDVTMTTMNRIMYIILSILTIALISLFVLLFRIRKQLTDKLNCEIDNNTNSWRQETKELRNSISQLRAELPTEAKVKNWITSENQKQSSNVSQQKTNIPTQVADKIEPQQQIVEKPKPSPVPMIDTDQVDCNWDNGYFTLQANEKPIFRIYQKGNTFYYTLVESIRSIMPSMLFSTEQFIIVNKRTPVVAKGVEIVKEGIALKESDGRFRVDPNNKLVIDII